MPTLRIVSDSKSNLYVDGYHVGELIPKTVFQCEVSQGDHFIDAVSVFNDKLRYNRIVSVLYDQVHVFNFSELIRDNIEIRNGLELFRYQHDKKYGFFEPITRSVVIEPQYDKCGHFSKKGFAIAENNNCKGVINKKGEIVIPFEYDSIFESSYDEKLFEVHKGDNVGYIDQNGQFRIQMQSNPVNFVTWRDGNENRYFGYYLKQNEYAILHNSDHKVIVCGSYDSFSVSSNYIIASQDKQKNVFTKNGELLFSCDYSDIECKGAAFIVSKQFSQARKYGIVDLSGHCIVPLEYDDIYSYQNGFFSLQIEGAPNRIVRYDGLELKERLITSDYDLYQNYFLKRQDHSIILIDIRRNAEYHIECENISFLDGDYFGHNPDYLRIEKSNGFTSKYGLLRISSRLEYLTDCEYDEIYKFENGYACVKSGFRYGAIDMHGNLVVPCTYQYQFTFNEDGYAEVYKVEDSESWLCPYNYLGYGIIDSSNKTIIGFDQYDKIYWQRFTSEYKSKYPVVRLEKNGTSYLIDYDNKIVATYGPEYNFVFYNTCDCMVRIKSVDDAKSRYGYVDKFGRLVIPCKFDDIRKLNNDLLICKLNGKYAIFGSDGHQITEHVYEDIDGDIDYDDECNEVSKNNGYMIAHKKSGYGVIDKRGNEILDFIYSAIQTYYKNEPFDVDINTLLDWDTGDEGEVYATLCATKEGPFRYDIAYVRKAVGQQYELCGIDGEPIILRKLGEPISTVLSANRPSTVKRISPFEGLRDLFVQDTFEKVLKLAGVTYGERQYYISELQENEKLELRREKNNVYDSNAVAVHDLRGRHLGYIPKSDAGEIARRLDKGEMLNAFVLEKLGGVDFNWGLRIKITR